MGKEAKMKTRSWTDPLVLLSPALLAACGATHLPEPAPTPDPATAQITVLYDAFGESSAMRKDWGFSALIEYRGKRILFDTGNDAEVFAHNVRAKGIDLTRLDFAVVSHRHGDHMAGLNHLLDVNPGVRIYTPKENFGVFGAALPGTFYRRDSSLPASMRYYGGEPPETLRFGTAWPRGNFVWVTQTTEVAPGLHLIVLKGSWGVDLDVMEMSLAIDTPDGTIVIAGCSHPTIERIVRAARETTGQAIHLVIGGAHLLPANDEEIRRIATAMRDTLKVEWVAPTHCTGEPAFAILKEAFGDRYLYAGLGTRLSVGPTVKVRSGSGRSPAGPMDEAELRTYRRLLARSEDNPERMLAHGRLASLKSSPRSPAIVARGP
jgi:7,8-dihydropterin-6-yl-methyl-4-(beta-D-ribofuranosyl)aminobenzene 5'-phosphate synthase